MCFVVVATYPAAYATAGQFQQVLAQHTPTGPTQQKEGTLPTIATAHAWQGSTPSGALVTADYYYYSALDYAFQNSFIGVS